MIHVCRKSPLILLKSWETNFTEHVDAYPNTDPTQIHVYIYLSNLIYMHAPNSGEFCSNIYNGA